MIVPRPGLTILEEIRLRAKAGTLSKVDRSEAARVRREAISPPSLMTSEVRYVIAVVARRHNLEVEEICERRLGRPYILARRDAIVALYRAYPDRPWSWYARPFRLGTPSAVVNALKRAGVYEMRTVASARAMARRLEAA